MENTRQPKRISPDPIIEAVVEVRFSTKIPPEAVLGVVYNSINEVIDGKHQPLPIMQLPENIRQQERSLEYAPYYQFNNTDYQISVGPKVLAISCNRPYNGWDSYYQVIEKTITKIFELNFIDKFHRIGVRYIDLFENTNLFDHLKFNIEDFPYSLEQSSISTTFKAIDDFTTNLQVANSESLVINGEILKGSIFDTDTFKELDKILTTEELLSLISKAHEVDKRLFFELITEDFIAKYNPEYE